MNILYGDPFLSNAEKRTNRRVINEGNSESAVPTERRKVRKRPNGYVVNDLATEVRNYIRFPD